MPGVFIVFEGIDGCGKSTQLELYAQHLRDAGIEPVLTREPWDGTAYGFDVEARHTGLRHIIMSRAQAGASDEEMALLFAADRRAHDAAVIAPALAEGRTVLCDRHLPSSYAFQAAGCAPSAAIASFIARINHSARTPDAIVIVEIPAIVAFERCGSRSVVTAFDAARLDTIKKRVSTYEAIEDFVEAGCVIRVDGRGPRTWVAEAVRVRLQDLVFNDRSSDP